MASPAAGGSKGGAESTQSRHFHVATFEECSSRHGSTSTCSSEFGRTTTAAVRWRRSGGGLVATRSRPVLPRLVITLFEPLCEPRESAAPYRKRHSWLLSGSR